MVAAGSTFVVMVVPVNRESLVERVNVSVLSDRVVENPVMTTEKLFSARLIMLAERSCGADRLIVTAKEGGEAGVRSKPLCVANVGVILIVPATVPVWNATAVEPLSKTASVEFAGIVKCAVGNAQRARLIAGVIGRKPNRKHQSLTLLVLFTIINHGVNANVQRIIRVMISHSIRRIQYRTLLTRSKVLLRSSTVTFRGVGHQGPLE